MLGWLVLVIEVILVMAVAELATAGLYKAVLRFMTTKLHPTAC